MLVVLTTPPALLHIPLYLPLSKKIDKGGQAFR